MIDGQSGRDEGLYLDPLVELVQAGESPADRLLAKLDPTRDLAPQVLEHARL